MSNKFKIAFVLEHINPYEVTFQKNLCLPLENEVLRS